MTRLQFCPSFKFINATLPLETPELMPGLRFMILATSGPLGLATLLLGDSTYTH